MIDIKIEPLTDELFAEILPLAQACWNESTELKGEHCAYYGDRDFLIEPDVDQYKTLQAAGGLVIVTARGEGVLVGYLIGILYRSLHHRHITCALGDSMYLKPEYRFTHAGAVANLFERTLTDIGIGIIGWPAHRSSPLYDFLQSRGYVEDDTVMEKRLKMGVN